MAVYRIHKKDWEKGSRPHLISKVASTSSTPTTPKKASKRTAVEAEFASDAESESESDSDEPSTSKTKLKSTAKTTTAGKKGKIKDSSTTFPGGGRKGVSSGLSTVIKKIGAVSPGSKTSLSSHSKAAGSAGKSEWWKQLPGGVSIGGGAEASMTIGVKR